MTFKNNNKNISNLLKFVNRSKGSNKLDIADRIGVSPAYLTKISKYLLSENILLEKKYIDKRKKKKNLLVINYDRFYSIGALINGDFTKIIITNLKNDVLDEISFKNIYSKEFDEYLQILLKNIVELSSLKPQYQDNIIGIGIVITNDFIIKNTLDLFKEDRFKSFKKDVQSLNLGRVYVETQIRAEALYQAYLEPKYENFFLIEYSKKRGRGSGIIIGNKLIKPIIPYYRSMGSRHFIIEPNSKEYCEICKKRGCFESIVSLKNIFNEILKENSDLSQLRKTYENMSIDEFIKRAEAGGITECKALRKIARYIAILVINHNNLVPLDTFLLSGKIFKSVLFLSYLRMYLQNFQLGEVHEKLIVLDENIEKEEITASFLPINYIFYNHNVRKNNID